MATAAEPVAMPLPNLYAGLSKFGLPQQFIPEIDSCEGLAVALLQLIRLYKDGRQQGRKTCAGTITAPRTVPIQNSILARNLSHAGASKEEVTMLCDDPVLQAVAVRLISEYRTAIASNMHSFYFSFVMRED